MKYGLRERITGAVILVALLIIIVPFFFKSNHATRDESGLQVTVNQSPLTFPNEEITHLDQAGNPTGISNELTQYAQLIPQSDENQSGETQVKVQPLSGEAMPQSLSDDQASAGSFAISKPEAPATVHAPASKPVSKPISPPVVKSEATSDHIDPIMAIVKQKEANQRLAAVDGQSRSWSVQSGSFTRAENANRMLQQLQSLGFPGYLFERGANHVVMVGPFTSAEQAQSVLIELKEQAKINGFIILRNQHAG